MQVVDDGADLGEVLVRNTVKGAGSGTFLLSSTCFRLREARGVSHHALALGDVAAHVGGVHVGQRVGVGGEAQDLPVGELVDAGDLAGFSAVSPAAT